MPWPIASRFGCDRVRCSVRNHSHAVQACGLVSNRAIRDGESTSDLVIEYGVRVHAERSCQNES